MALISKYSVSSSKSLSHSCHARQVSLGLCGILNEFILNDVPKVETQISVGLLVLPVLHLALYFSNTRSVRCPVRLIISSFVFDCNLASILFVGFLFSSVFHFL